MEHEQARLDREQVQHIAELAKLALSEDEMDLFAEQLSEILAFFETINRLDTSHIPPTAQAIPLRNVTRPDEVQPSLSPDEALANAPRRQAGFFRTRRILE